MVDFIKLLLIDPYLIRRLRESDLIVWKLSIIFPSPKKSCTLRIDRYEYQGIIFDFGPNDKWVKIHFKPHYFFNNNEHNANDFSVESCVVTLNQFLSRFKLDPKKLKVINLEFGLNLSPSGITGKYLVENCIYISKTPMSNTTGLEFAKQSITRGKSVFKGFKIYDKRFQFPYLVKNELVRLEITSAQAKFIQTLGIKTMSDLLNLEVYDNMAMRLIEEIEHLLILDPKLELSCSPKERAYYNKCLRHDYWSNLAKDRSRNKFIRHRNKFEQFIQIHGGRNIKQELIELAQIKLLTLLENGADSN